jgi:hypothetical protein
MLDQLNKRIEEMEQWLRVNNDTIQLMEKIYGKDSVQYGEAFGISRTLTTVLKDLKQLQLVSR